MSASLYQLLYYSQNRIDAGHADLDAEIGTILETSRRNNAAAGVTGALMFNAGIFAQVLEGELPRVEETFERIQQDARHGEVSVLTLEPIPARAFSNWAMGFVGLSPEEADRFSAISQAGGFDPSRLGGQTLHRLLMDLMLESHG